MAERVLHVAGGHGGAFDVKAGDVFVLVDLEGQQAIDFVAFSAADQGETLSGIETRLALRSLYIKCGDVLMSSRGRPMLEIVEDTIGTHDYTVPACDASRFAVDFGCPGHRNCLDNMYEPLRAYGIRTPLALPEPFNFFQNSPVVEDGRTAVVDPPSRPGDRIALRALMDVVCAVSSCPQDIIPGNGLRPTPVEVRYPAEEA
ncbi:urea carboxylase-associated family protein [Pseudoxanthobacter sp.]|uniref:urea carboxylase-associated family protein n=1 Tax=Pseudoxanthobacter sp. TaxID=1925742 RepID=UPI002FE36D23